jgi:hypothetical protein
MIRRLVVQVAIVLLAFPSPPPVSADQRLLIREVPGLHCRATQSPYEFLLSHPGFAAALFGRLYPPLEGYSVTQPTPRLIRFIDRRWGLDGEAELLAIQPGKRIYRTEIGVAVTETWQLSAPMEIVLEYRQARAEPNPLMVSHLAFYLLPTPTLPSVLAQAAAQLLVPLINRQVEAVTEGSRRGCDRLTNDPGGLYDEMATWPEMPKPDLISYYHLFLADRPSR